MLLFWFGGDCIISFYLINLFFSSSYFEQIAVAPISRSSRRLNIPEANGSRRELSKLPRSSWVTFFLLWLMIRP